MIVIKVLNEFALLLLVKIYDFIKQYLWNFIFLIADIKTIKLLSDISFNKYLFKWLDISGIPSL
jgi:hypothetical protein